MKIVTDHYQDSILHFSFYIINFSKMDVKQIKEVGAQVRRDIVRMVHGSQSGHPGGSLGCTDLVVAYFNEFSSVKAYLENSITESRERGYTETKYGRIRYIEGIDSRNGTTRKIAERMAVNAPIQGLAADIIKEAMVNIDRYILQNKLQSRMILQVHDELVFDAKDDELPLLVPEVVRLMETKAAFIVPLKVSVTVGKNWLEQSEYKFAIQ